jgi:hypothetical protein
MPSMDPQQLATILQSLAALRIKPADVYMQQLLAAAGRLLPSFSPDGLGMTAYALTLLGAAPRSAWRRAFVSAMAAALDGCSGHNLACFAMLLAFWRTDPGAAWWGGYFAACNGALGRGGFTPQGLGIAARGMATLGVVPPARWRARFFDEALRQQMARSRKGMVAAAVALGVWCDGGGGSRVSSINHTEEEPNHSSSSKSAASSSTRQAPAGGRAGGPPPPLLPEARPSAAPHQLAAQCLDGLSRHAGALTMGELAAALWGLSRSGAPPPRPELLEPVWQVRGGVYRFFPDAAPSVVGIQPLGARGL